MALFYLTYLSLSLSRFLYLFEISKFCNVMFIFNFHRHTEVKLIMKFVSSQSLRQKISSSHVKLKPNQTLSQPFHKCHSSMNVNTLSIFDFGDRLRSIGILLAFTSHETSKLAHCIDMFIKSAHPSPAAPTCPNIGP